MSGIDMLRPSPEEYAAFFAGYVDLVPESDVISVLRTQPAVIKNLSRSVAPGDVDFRYAPEKWTIREVFGHIVDCERVFSYRAMAVARGETAHLPGFDENVYVRNAGFSKRSIEDITSEFELLRLSNVMMLENLENEAWLRLGISNEKPMTPRGLAFVMAGHVRHHIRVLEERYLRK